MHSHSEVVTIVNEVVETLNERAEGYQRAADHVKDPTVESIFREFAMRSKDYISELQPFSDTSPDEIGKGPLGTIYQGWMNLKEKITGYNTKSILGDCITGEEAAIKVYQGAMKDEDLPAELKTILSRQFTEISSAQDKLKNLKEQFD
jgi:uncharacterized protein (TIGR02284 family)